MHFALVSSLFVNPPTWGQDADETGRAGDASRIDRV
jgi:hypothetical protein